MYHIAIDPYNALRQLNRASIQEVVEGEGCTGSIDINMDLSDSLLQRPGHLLQPSTDMQRPVGFPASCMLIAKESVRQPSKTRAMA